MEHERQSRRKLENFIRKQIKAGNVQIGGEGIKNINDLFFKNYEHESSIRSEHFIENRTVLHKKISK